MNIGLVGHVDHGKTSITQALTGKWTDTHSEELKRGISIKLGYADFSTYRCLNCGLYQHTDKCSSCGNEARFLRRLSILDAPGHETLMTTAIASGNIIDGAILVIAANEQCPQPQTLEHLMIMKILGIKNIVVVQNKVDLVSRENALKNHQQIVEFLAANGYSHVPIIPVAAHLKVNMDKVIEAIEKYIPTPQRDLTKPAKMFVARSFDINKPGTEIQKLSGGILGGSLVQGEVKIGDVLEIRPMPNDYGKESGELEVVQIFSGSEKLDSAKPGGLIAFLTKFDPFWTKSDSMIGSVVGKPGTLPELYSKFTMDYTPLDRQDLKMPAFVESEPIVLNAGTSTAVAFIKSNKKGNLELILKAKLLIDKDMIIAVSRRVKQRWRLAGYGKMVD